MPEVIQRRLAPIVRFRPPLSTAQGFIAYDLAPYVDRDAPFFFDVDVAVLPEPVADAPRRLWHKAHIHTTEPAPPQGTPVMDGSQDKALVALPPVDSGIAAAHASRIVARELEHAVELGHFRLVGDDIERGLLVRICATAPAAAIADDDSVGIANRRPETNVVHVAEDAGRIHDPPSCDE